ncbi:MAG TPA: hypothetical protein VIG69_14215 [Candidatus Methylomirabilis sp.]|jgi:hypothetical protein
MAGTGWLWFSAFATVSVTPVFIAIPFFIKNFLVKPETFTAWYFASVSVGIALWLWLDGRAADLHPGGLRAAAGIALVGLSFGAAANGFLFRAVSVAPNPGLPPVMYSGASVIVFLASAALADRLPRFFDRVNTDFDRFLGILLVIAGVFLIAGGWPLLKGAVTR